MAEFKYPPSVTLRNHVLLDLPARSAREPFFQRGKRNGIKAAAINGRELGLWAIVQVAVDYRIAGGNKEVAQAGHTAKYRFDDGVSRSDRLWKTLAEGDGWVNWLELATLLAKFGAAFAGPVSRLLVRHTLVRSTRPARR